MSCDPCSAAVLFSLNLEELRLHCANAFHPALTGVTPRPPRPLPLPPASPAKSGCSPAPCSSPAVSNQKIHHAPAQPSPTPRCSSRTSACAPHHLASPQPSPAPPQYSGWFALSAH